MRTMKRTTASPAVALAARLNPEPRRAVPVFLNDGRPIVSADTAADSPELNPAADAFGRFVGFLSVETDAGAGDARPTHATIAAANLEAELAPLGIYRTADGRLLAHCRLDSLAGAKIECGAGFYLELNPAAPLCAVWDALFAAAYPAAVEG